MYIIYIYIHFVCNTYVCTKIGKTTCKNYTPNIEVFSRFQLLFTHLIILKNFPLNFTSVGLCVQQNNTLSYHFL